MPKVSPIQTSFGAGEFSPLLDGQVELDRYRQALDTCLNYIPTLQGGLVRRSGTKYVADTKTSSEKSRLVPFEFSVTQAYVLEFGDQYIRFYKDNGQIESSPSVPYEISTPYLEADLFDIRYTQSADVMYLVHPSYAPRKLSRSGDTSWTLEEVTFVDGPYLPLNTTTIDLTPGAATGTGVTLKSGPAKAITGAVDNGSGLIRITATGHGFASADRIGIEAVTGTTEANGDWAIAVIDPNTFDLVGSTFTNTYISGGTAHPRVFESTDVGRSIRIQEGSVWGWATIASYVHYGSVTIDIEETLTNTNAKTFWRLGAWSETTGYPATVTFHEDRLFYAGNTSTPQRMDGSEIGFYENFKPSGLDGTVVATNAVSFTFNANDVNAVRWILSDEKGLIAGTVGGEWIVRPTSRGEALTPTNITAKRSTTYGSADIQAVQVGRSVLFTQRAKRKVRELTYFFDADGFRATDITLLSEHVTESGLVEMDSQKEPQPITWCVREDGALAAVTYERDVDSFKVGWHRHIVGGVSDAAGSAAKVESVAVIPSPDGNRDDLWLLVQRYVNGAVVRHVEYMTKIFDDTVAQKDAFFVDSGLTYDAPEDITAVTKADPAVVTITGHSFLDGDKILISDVKGMTELNGNSYLVANKTANTFELTDLDGVDIDSTGFTTYVSGGEAREYVTVISGLDHLEGETVAILGDGAVIPDEVVSSGSVTLDTEATTVHIGYGFVSDGKMLRLNAGAADGTAIGKTQRTHRIGIMLHRSLGLKIGTDFSDLTELTFRTEADLLSRAPALFTGILSETLETDYDFENQFCFRQDQPLPTMILALMPQMHTQDR